MCALNDERVRARMANWGKWPNDYGKLAYLPKGPVVYGIQIKQTFESQHQKYFNFDSDLDGFFLNPQLLKMDLSGKWCLRQEQTLDQKLWTNI